MDLVLDIGTFLEKAKTLPVIDVRTPAEYEQGHIPRARNLPLFSNEERKQVGITYKKAGQQEAIMTGLELAGPKMKSMAREVSGIAVNRQVLVHCWRGGMRSKSMAWLFGTVGIQSLILEGGYKSFRRHVLDFLEKDFPFIVLGGLTGSGKTDVLRALGQMGEQVLDLEMLAHHKGSAFGGLGQPPQNTNEQFENDLFRQLHHMDPEKSIWVEDESRNIGKNTLTAGIHRNIRTAPLVLLDVPRDQRVENLVRDYAGFPEKDLTEAVLRIRPRLGDRMAQEAVESIRSGKFRHTVERVLHYYDKTYRYGLNRREKNRVFSMLVENRSDPAELAGRILDFIMQNRIKELNL